MGWGRAGPEEMGHFLVRSVFYTDGEGAERLAPKEVAGQLLELYYRVLTRNGVVRRRSHPRRRAVLIGRACVYSLPRRIRTT